MYFVNWVKRSKKQVQELFSARSLNFALGVSLFLAYFSDWFRKNDEPDLAEQSAKSQSSKDDILDVSAAVGVELLSPDLAFDQSNLDTLLANLPVTQPVENISNSDWIPLSNNVCTNLLKFEPVGDSFKAFDKALVEQYWDIEDYQVYTLGYIDETPIGLCYPEEDDAFILWDVNAAYVLGGLAVLLGAANLYDGSNDPVVSEIENVAPELIGNLEATVAEGEAYTLTATDLGYTDVDDTDEGVAFTVSSALNGSIQVLGETVTTFTGVELVGGLVNFVHDGTETTTAFFEINVEDGNEDSSDPVNSTFNFTVTPVNDAPILEPATDRVSEGGTILGELQATDLDLPDGELLLYSTSSTVAGLTLFSDGAYVFNASSFDYLPAGEEVIVDIPVTVTDDQGATSDSSLTITVVGTNDNATVGDDFKALVETDTVLTASGTISISDADLGEAKVVAQENVAGSSDLGKFTIDVDGNWTFTANSPLHDLDEGEVVTDTLIVSSLDGTDSGLVTVQITGIENIPPTVEVVIEKSQIDEVAMLTAGDFDVRFTFSEEVMGFTADDISIDLGQVVSGSLQVDADDPLVWHAEIRISEEEILAWAQGELGVITVGANGFSDLSGTRNELGDEAYYRVFSDDQYQLSDALVMVDSFFNPTTYEFSSIPQEDQLNLVLQGTADNDFIDGGAGDDILYGFSGDDVLIGNSEDDTLLGGLGADILVGGEGDDFSFGGNDDDIYYADILGPEYNTQDIFIGGEGVDSAYFSLSSDQYSLNVMTVSQEALINEMLIGFREVASEEFDSFDPQQLVIEVVSYSETQDVEVISSTHTTFVQAESLVFNDLNIYLVDPFVASTTEGTDQNDLFIVNALLDQPVIQIDDFAVGMDTVNILGVYDLNSDSSVNQEADMNAILSAFDLQSDGLSAEIDLSEFVDYEGKTLEGSIHINFSEKIDTISAGSFINDSNPLQTDRWEDELLAANLQT